MGRVGQYGFSLVEMLVVLGLLAMATAISFPVLQNSKRQNEVVTTQSAVIRSLSEARNRALLTGLDQYVDINTKNRTLSGNHVDILFPDTVLVSTESAKFEMLNGVSRYVFFGAGGNSGGKIVVERAPQAEGGFSTIYEIGLNWFSGEISLIILKDSHGG